MLGAWLSADRNLSESELDCVIQRAREDLVAYAITNPIKPRDIDAPTPRKRRRKEKRRKA